MVKIENAHGNVERKRTGRSTGLTTRSCLLVMLVTIFVVAFLPMTLFQPHFIAKKLSSSSGNPLLENFVPKTDHADDKRPVKAKIPALTPEDEKKLDKLHASTTPLQPELGGLGLRPHPHAGARDEHGNFHHRHDPTALQKSSNVVILSTGEYDICSIPPGEGEEGPGGYQTLTKIRAGMERERRRKRALPTVLCIVYTNSNRHYQISSLVQTWAGRCNGFLAASNLTDRSIGAVDLLHHGDESYKNMWQKVRSIWGYVHDYYLEEYDYFHIGGDDMYLIVDNLRFYLENLTSTEPLYLGGSIPFGSDKRYCGGGSGYTLNRAALSLLVTQLFPKCGVHNPRQPEEDILVARCFFPRHVYCHNTLDEKGGTRYHALDAQHAHAKSIVYPKLEAKPHKFKFGRGKDKVSDTSVSFHLTKKHLKEGDRLAVLARDNPFDDYGMRRYHAILYRLCGDRL